MTLSTRIGVMNAGEIVQVGEPAEIYEYPNSRFVADFIGSVNIFEGRVVADEADYIRIASADVGGEIHVGHGVPCKLDQTLWYAVRPEKMRVTRERPDGSHNIVPGTVEEIGYLGNLSIYRIRLDTGKVVRATRANLDRHDAEGGISWDEKVWVSWGDTAGVVLTS